MIRQEDVILKPDDDAPVVIRDRQLFGRDSQFNRFSFHERGWVLVRSRLPVQSSRAMDWFVALTCWMSLWLVEVNWQRYKPRGLQLRFVMY